MSIHQLKNTCFLGIFLLGYFLGIFLPSADLRGGSTNGTSALLELEKKFPGTRTGETRCDRELRAPVATELSSSRAGLNLEPALCELAVLCGDLEVALLCLYFCISHTYTDAVMLDKCLGSKDGWAGSRASWEKTLLEKISHNTL